LRCHHHGHGFAALLGKQGQAALTGLWLEHLPSQHMKGYILEG
jgi:hypothetical protein